MAINLGARPLAGFSEPIEMMKDCHRRIEHFLDVLREAERQFGGSLLDDEGRRALEVSLNYFVNYAPRHTADEERSLFPRIRCSEDVDARAVMNDLDRLEDDHRRCEACQAIVEQLISQWLETGRLNEMQRKHLCTVLGELNDIYVAHIQQEETRVFAIASRILEAEQIRQIGDEMKSRRSLGGAESTSVGSSDKERS